MHFDSITTAKIPFPVIDLNNRIHKARYEVIIQAVEQITILKKEYNTVKLSASIGLINEKIDRLQEKIDRAVCELFGLSQNEIEIIN